MVFWVELSKMAIRCLKLMIETLQQSVKYVYSSETGIIK